MIGLLRCTFQWFKTDDATFAQNVLYFDTDGNDLTPDTIGQDLQNNFWVFLKPMVSNVVRLEQIFIKELNNVPDTGAVPFSANLSVGTSGFNVLHQVLGPVFQFYDGGAGPKHRGRMYPYGVTSNHLNRSGPQPSLVTAFATWRTNMLTRYSNSGTSPLVHMIYHRRVAPDPVAWSPVTDYRLAPRLGVQRRRNFAVGL